MANAIFPQDGFIFDTHTDIQNTFIEKIHTQSIEAALDWLRTVKNDTERTYPRPLEFRWENDGSEEYAFELAERADFGDSAVTVTRENTLSVENLKIGQKYFWRVNKGEARSFETKSDSPRFIRIDGALNVRDVGGIRIRQGLCYRGSAIDTPFRITEAGRRAFIDQLGIKTQIDLRKDMLGKADGPAPGEPVRLVQLPYRPYREVFEDEHRANIRRIMEFLADESNYPVYFHCMGGADRTGMIALYLRALAGESDDDIHTDYELTALSTYALGAAENAIGFRSRHAPYYTEFLDGIAAYAPGQPLSVSIPAFLESCGVTRECMDRIRRIIMK